MVVSRVTAISETVATLNPVHCFRETLGVWKFKDGLLFNQIKIHVVAKLYLTFTVSWKAVLAKMPITIRTLHAYVITGHFMQVITAFILSSQQLHYFEIYVTYFKGTVYPLAEGRAVT